MTKPELQCDGCGQLASPQHIAQRLQRLEWTTRYRPVHIGTLLLGAVAPQNDSEFVYSSAANWNGEAQVLLAAAGLTASGKSPDAVLADFQRGGFFVTHVLECPVEKAEFGSLNQRIADRLPAVLARIRRSLKPKRLVPISLALEPFLPALNSGELPCAILLDQGKPFALDVDTANESVKRLQEAMASLVGFAAQSFA